MPAPAEGPAQGGAAEAIYDQRWGRMASLATGDAGILPTLPGVAISAMASAPAERLPKCEVLCHHVLPSRLVSRRYSRES
jgi:hypothetical protein